MRNKGEIKEWNTKWLSLVIIFLEVGKQGHPFFNSWQLSSCYSNTDRTESIKDIVSNHYNTQKNIGKRLSIIDKGTHLYVVSLAKCTSVAIDLLLADHAMLL